MSEKGPGAAPREIKPVMLKQAEKLMGEIRGCDRGHLKRDLERIKKARRKTKDSSDSHAALEKLISGLKASAEERRRRMSTPPDTSYPAELPIVVRREEIVDAIRKNQVIVLSGETGSGKTTQIPKMCIEAGRGVDGLIGCTQPRRIAAITVAERIAEELKNPELVGCKIRFHDSSKAPNYIRVMTDGILLAEAQGHPALNAYDTLIIDEAHERSLNIDVLLGMVRKLIDRRRNLKVIITSATLDTQKFSKHFRDAPIIEVSGRTYPVEIRYEEPVEGSDRENAASSLAERTAVAISSLMKESRSGDILAFLPTEIDIRETMMIAGREFADRLNIVPLYARLSSSEQKKAFASGGRRKLIVATNVAETSLTIPGIRYVVDTGLARISRYNPGTGTHGLPVDPISRASADQRAGRCGRVANGICIRMYSEEDYLARPKFTLPEIRRTNLAEVVLSLLDVGIKDIEAFPFVDPPDSAGIRDALRTLREIGALEAGALEGGGDASSKSEGNSRTKKSDSRRLSRDGRLMARLPLDPRLAKVLLQADREGCLGDVLPIAAALSLPDPRERPPEKAGSADNAHRKFIDEQSDFIGWLNIWDAFRTYKRKGSYSGKLKKFCSENYLSFRRMKEWMDIHRQLTLVMEENGYRPRRREAGLSLDKKGNFSERYAVIHRAILSGFLSHIARLEEKGVYEATRNRKVRIHPGSALSRGASPWIMAAEIVRTSRLYARSAAAIDPGWLVDLGSDLASRNWIDPHWSRKSGAVLATEQMRLYGFLISGDRIVPYGTVRSSEAREIFIRKALVEGDIADSSPYPFLRANWRLIRRLEGMEEKLRRRDLVAGEEAVASFYAQALPRDVIDLGTLNLYIRQQGEKKLLMSEEDLLTGVPDGKHLAAFPDSVEIAGDKWKLSYVFDSESENDGVSLKIPSGRLSDLTPDKTDWMVPGLLEEKVEALIRGLEKKYRRKLIPIPETAVQALKGMKQEGVDLIRALTAWLYRERKVDIPLSAWNPDKLPVHLQVRFSLLDDSGRELAAGRDPSVLTTVKTSTDDKGRSSRYRKEHEIPGLQTWPDMDIPESVSIPGGAVLWPALVSEGTSAALRYLDNRNDAQAAHRKGLAVLAGIHWSREIRDFKKTLHISGESRVIANYIGGAATLENALWQRVIDDVFAVDCVREKKVWNKVLKDGGGEIHSKAAGYLEQITTVLSCYSEQRKILTALEISSHRPDFIKARLKDLEEMLTGDFILRYEPETWKSLPRWMKAVVSRARKGTADPLKDKKAVGIWNPLKEQLDDIKDNLSPMSGREKRKSLAEARIMIEELKVALFAAGDIRPAGKISESRMSKKLEEVKRLL